MDATASLMENNGPLTGCAPAANPAVARKVLGWPERCKLATALLWKYGCKRLKSAQLLGQLGVFLTLDRAWGDNSRSARGAKVRNLR
jgi:hypothetical protein